VRMLEACVRAGQLDGVKAVAEQVAWHVRSGQQLPEVYFEGPKWKLDEAAAALTPVTVAPEDEPPPPQVSIRSAMDACVCVTLII
jgi:hypothetical protein